MGEPIVDSTRTLKSPNTGGKNLKTQGLRNDESLITEFRKFTPVSKK